MRDLTNNQKGAIAEAAAELAAVRCGIDVYRPASGHSRADLIFDVYRRLWRVQVKWGRISPDSTSIIVHIGGSYLSPSGYVRSTYSDDEIDLLVVYCGDLDRCFLLPIERFAGRGSVQLRLSPPRNNQRACITLADEFSFEGAVAQMGERVTGSHEVRGSIPLSSIDSPPTSGSAVVVGEDVPATDVAPTTIGANVFRDGLGYWMDRVAGGEEITVTRHGRPRFRMVPV